MQYKIPQFFYKGGQEKRGDCFNPPIGEINTQDRAFNGGIKKERLVGGVLKRKQGS